MLDCCLLFCCFGRSITHWTPYQPQWNLARFALTDDLDRSCRPFSITPATRRRGTAKEQVRSNLINIFPTLRVYRRPHRTISLRVSQGNLSEGRCSLEKRQSLWWSRQLGDNNVHLEATAVDLGGKLTSGKPYWRDFGWICVPKCSPPETPRFEVGFGELCFIHLGSNARMEATFWGQIGAKFGHLWALLRYLEATATAMLLEAKWGDLEGKLGYREVVFKPSWGILFGHVVAFAARNVLPQQDQDFKWVSASYAGSTWGQSTAILWPRWCHLGAKFGDFGVKFGDFGAVLKAIWDHFRPCYFGIFTPNYTSKTLSPVALEAQQNKCKKPIKNQNLLQNANLHGSKANT